MNTMPKRTTTIPNVHKENLAIFFNILQRLFPYDFLYRNCFDHHIVQNRRARFDSNQRTGLHQVRKLCKIALLISLAARVQMAAADFRQSLAVAEVW